MGQTRSQTQEVTAARTCRSWLGYASPRCFREGGWAPPVLLEVPPGRKPGSEASSEVHTQCSVSTRSSKKEVTQSCGPGGCRVRW